MMGYTHREYFRVFLHLSLHSITERNRREQDREQYPDFTRRHNGTENRSPKGSSLREVSYPWAWGWTPAPGCWRERARFSTCSPFGRKRHDHLLRPSPAEARRAGALSSGNRPPAAQSVCRPALRNVPTPGACQRRSNAKRLGDCRGWKRRSIQQPRELEAPGSAVCTLAGARSLGSYVPRLANLAAMLQPGERPTGNAARFPPPSLLPGSIQNLRSSPENTL